MATARFYSFLKRRNSTLQPSGTDGTEITVYLKGGSDLVTPTFTINSATLPTYNYMSFESRYYFITGIKNVRDQLYEITAECDVLATYKTAVQATSAYVLYYTHSNTEIADRRLSVKATQTTQSNTGSFGFLGKNHCFILTVIGEDATASYALTPSQIRDLYATDYRDSFDASINNLQPVTGVSFADTISDFARWIGDFLKSSAGAFNYAGTISENIKSCIILPVAAGAIGGTPNADVIIGAIDTTVEGFRITDRFITDTATVNIPWQASDWRRLEPYHEVYLYIPALGLISLSASDLIGETALTVKVSMDVLSGDSIFEVKSSTKTVYYANTNLGTNYALGSSQTSPSAVTNALIGAAGLVTGNPAAALGGALGVANSLQPTPTCIGSNSGGAILGIDADTVKCYTVFHDTTVSPSSISSTKGTPYNGVLNLTSITGYVQTQDASVASVRALDSERQQINELMDGGIYIE